MKKTHILILLILVLVLLFFTGPKVEMQTRIPEIKLADDLDQYLKQQESNVPGIRPNTEKNIQWLDGEVGKKTPFSIVYLHGFGATRQEIAPVPEHVAQKIGANVFYTRLKGHGRDADAMAEASIQDWINDGYEALEIGKRLGDEIIILATSTGATLATWLLAQKTDYPVHSMIMVSPNFWPKNKAANIALYPWGKQILELGVGKYREWEPVNEQQRMYWSIKQRTSSLLPMMGLVKLVDQLDLSQLSIPLLVMISDHDQVVDSEITEQKFSEFGSPKKKMVKINDSEAVSQHLITGDISAPSKTVSTVQLIIEFVQ